MLFSDIEKEGEENEDYFVENIPDEEILPDESMQKLQDREVLIKILKKLSLEENEILTLYYQEEMTFDSIGKVLNKSLNTVKSKHRRALIKLKKMLG